MPGSRPRPVPRFSPCRCPLSLLASKSGIELCRCMGYHNGRCSQPRRLQLRQHRGDVTAAMARHYVLLTCTDPVARLCRRLAAAGRDDQAHGIGQVIIVHLGNTSSLCRPPSTSAVTPALHLHEPGGHVSGNVVTNEVPETHHNHVIAECHAAACMCACMAVLAHSRIHKDIAIFDNWD